MFSSLVIGDSQVKYVYQYLDPRYFNVISVSGMRVDQVPDYLYDIGIERYDDIILHVGTNSTPLKSWEQILRAFQDVVRRIRLLNPM